MRFNVIHVIASVHIKPGHLTEFIEIFNINVPEVLKEKGCIEYAPAVDVPTTIPPQELDKNLVTVVEKWDSVEDLEAHMVAPHMAVYHENVKDIVQKVSLKILENAQ